jgi:hypothetical protein
MIERVARHRQGLGQLPLWTNPHTLAWRDWMVHAQALACIWSEDRDDRERVLLWCARRVGLQLLQAAHMVLVMMRDQHAL